jgi:predicted kinase
MNYRSDRKVKSDRPTLILFCGLPGSGKTSMARKLAGELPAVRLCPDEWKADLGIDFFDEAVRTKLEARLWKLGKELLVQGQTVILENGFWGRTERDDYRREAAILNADTELHFLDVPFEELMNRIAIRNISGNYATVPLTRAHMEDYAKRFQAPDKDELALFTRSIVHSSKLD